LQVVCGFVAVTVLSLLPVAVLVSMVAVQALPTAANATLWAKPGACGGDVRAIAASVSVV
jgi:predicted permease